jgi:hypothetical protein
MDMPCVWCLLYINGRASQFDSITVHAHNPGRPDDAPVPVQHWAAAEEFVYGSGHVLRDQSGTRCGLEAKTLVSGDAVCFGHAMALLRARSR